MEDKKTQDIPPKAEYCEHNGYEFTCETCFKMCCAECFGANNCKDCGEEDLLSNQ